MAFLLYGVKKASIGNDEVFSYCPACECDRFQDILVTSNYYHVYYIPVFPFEKEVTFFCKTCGLQRKDVPLIKNTLTNYSEINRKFRHPWYTYIIAAGFAALFTIPAVIRFVSG